MSCDELEIDYSTPRHPRSNEKDTCYTSSTTITPCSTSILRSSSSMNNRETSTGKRVRIVSPMKWRHSQCSLERKRKFIDSTINFIDIKLILRSIGCDASGGYKECVEKLLQSDWCPTRRQIELNEKLRAKPIQHTDDRIIHLHRADIQYLSRFSLNELKKWLKYHNIQQPVGQNKEEYMRLINKNFSFQSPSPATFRARIPRRPTCGGSGSKRIGRTPRHFKKKLVQSEEKELESEEERDQKTNCDDVRMQLTF